MTHTTFRPSTLPLSEGEQFLQQHHDLSPGLSWEAFQHGTVVKNGLPSPGRTSYHLLLDRLETSSQAPNAKRTVLELACGDGGLLALLGHLPGVSRVGVDMSRGELEAARARLQAPPIWVPTPDMPCYVPEQPLTLIQARAQALPLPDGCADAVLCHMALMLMDPIQPVLEEVARVLKPGGHFCAVVGTPGAPDPFHHAFVQCLRQALADAGLKGIPLGDRRTRSEAGVQALFEAIPTFHSLTQEVFEVHYEVQRSTALQEAVHWFSTLYDVAFVPEAQRPALLEQVRLAFVPLLSEEGLARWFSSVRRIEVTRGQ